MRTIFDRFLTSDNYKGTPIASLTKYEKNGTCIPATKLSKE
jgi:hypothetical protein